MVYCGKPSKGCSHCRQRKIRCDIGVPACGQCIKAQKECPGYRNMLDLSFRNESEDVIKKARAKSRRSPPTRSKKASLVPRKASRDAATPNAASPVSSIVVPSTPQLTSNFVDFPTTFFNNTDYWLNTNPASSDLSIFSLQPTIEEDGINYFMFNFVKMPNGPSHGYFYYIEDLCRGCGFDGTLQPAMIATGLAGHANRTQSSYLMARARKEYAMALRRINAALRSPSEALKDSVLLAIVIVAIFETIAGAKELSLREWTEHVNGAATLVKLRGRTQLKHPGSLGLFIHATTHVMVSCVQREIPMPTQIIELREEAFNYLPMDPAYRQMRMMDEFSIFRSAVKSRSLNDPQANITKALEIDNDLAKSFTDVPPEWLYETVFTETDCEAVLSGSYDIYYDHWISQMWNAMRTSRIMLHEIIRSQLIKGFTATPRTFTAAEFRTQFQTSANICSKMRDEILRSVPQHVGFVTRKPFTSPHASSSSSPPDISDLFPELQSSTPQSQPFNPNNSFADLLFDEVFNPSLPSPKEHLHPDPTHPSIGGCFLLWPLYVAGITRVSTNEHRKYAANMLQYAGEHMGIRAGSNLAVFMRETHMVAMAPDTSERMKGGVELLGLGDADEVVLKVDIWRDERPKRPLLDMLAREEQERKERLRVGRVEEQEFYFG
ncbi:related to negative acting factor [Phialocephala subalpina]|uniref:Related to negative acting factor n=1 Tax=Phialocephala subalpina TaxID=576137 RepID=A0A1L7WX23_9HELO|nr:related to negative acting factor [Phialocephala subalpina]